MLRHVGRQEVEKDPLVVQLHPLHVIALLLGLEVTGHECQPCRLPSPSHHDTSTLERLGRIRRCDEGFTNKLAWGVVSYTEWTSAEGVLPLISRKINSH